LLVGAARFELATPCAQGRCATRLRYAPTLSFIAWARNGGKVTGETFPPPEMRARCALRFLGPARDG
jgi:hypothetical protein